MKFRSTINTILKEMIMKKYNQMILGGAISAVLLILVLYLNHHLPQLMGLWFLLFFIFDLFIYYWINQNSSE